VHIDPKALSASLEGLGSTDIGGIPVEAALERVMGAARGLFAVSGVGLMLVDDGGALRYVLGSDPAAQALERAQEDLVEGPCVDSFVLAEHVRTGDLITDPRWPRLGARLAGAGVRAVLGVPARLGGVPAGSLNVYRETPYAWDDSDEEAIGTYAGLVEGVLAGAVAARRGERIVAQLQGALDRRVVIERAVGLLMARLDTDAVGAFGSLRRAARDSRRRVADVAEDVLAGSELRIPAPQPRRG
jgi:GAF domain-containing protein